MYTWKQKKPELGVQEYNALLNSRRDEMLETEQTDASFVQEWIALTEERDLAVRTIHLEAMRKEMDHTLQQLHYWMQSALTRQTDKDCDLLPADLRGTVMECYSRVHKYLVTLRGVQLSSTSGGDHERDAPDGESQPTPSDRSADSKLCHSSDSSASLLEPVTPFDEQSIVSDATFESALSNNSQQIGIGGRYFPTAFSQRFILAQRLSTTLEISEPSSILDDSTLSNEYD
uniref:Uncharacterized protein n=1 Tax=Plectus sambesii TaxID=2011161 RepID=A0A914WPQ8_9BILA